MSTSEKDGMNLIRKRNRTIYTAGRPPWYNICGEPSQDALMIGISGGSASGKTTVAKKIISRLGIPWVSLLSMDSFYKELTPEQHELANKCEYNFDHIDAFDFDILIKTLNDLKQGRSVEIPVYNFQRHARESYTKKIYGASVVIFEGILVFCNEQILKMLDIKIFVDTDSDIRLARRLQRDVAERGRDIVDVLMQYERSVKPAFRHYIEPSIQYADIIIPRGGENTVAINMLKKHIERELSQRGICNRSILYNKNNNNSINHIKSLKVLESTNQIRHLHTIIRNRNTPRDEFIFYANRLMRLVIEQASSLLPYEKCDVEVCDSCDSSTNNSEDESHPESSDQLKNENKQVYSGCRRTNINMCGVSILRAGECVEQALAEIYYDIRIGKILIQSNEETQEPELYYERLPRDIASHIVFLLDATIATGAAAIMAIRVLLDHYVQEKNIYLLTLLASKEGIMNIAYCYPNVTIVTSAVDTKVNEQFHILPGIGNFGDRYYGSDHLHDDDDEDDEFPNEIIDSFDDLTGDDDEELPIQKNSEDEKKENKTDENSINEYNTVLQSKQQKEVQFDENSKKIELVLKQQKVEQN
ncbi:hypothetical protein SNEBB_010842 [Seison nebaliae]|nr:hypothetical protein SNEBB_010842 [Seison nebaliae]